MASNLIKETYLKNVDYYPNTRIARLDFVEVQLYQTVERYVTRNHVRNPVYSEWKRKEKHIKKTIKLTNHELEFLNIHENPLIKKNAKEIIEYLNDESLQPSWYKRDLLTRQRNESIAKIDEKMKCIRTESLLEIDKLFDEINIEKKSLNNRKLLVEKLEKKINKKKTILDKIQKEKQILWKKIATLGLFCLFVSEQRIRRIKNRIENLKEKLISLKDEEKSIGFTITQLNEKVDNCRNQTEKELNKAQKKKEHIEHYYTRQIKEVRSLPSDISEQENDVDFKPLKCFAGFEYQKIMGCYIIRNRNNNKCYVGQSKDVLKRLKQHFRETTPRNLVFAEDYYQTPYEERKDLFEVKIIECYTKDELDNRERELIAEYDSMNNGYNSTSGNT